MSKASRAKGRKGQSEAIALLESRDWICGDLSAGISSEDILALNPDGKAYAVEVKNCVSINVRAFIKQARANAQTRKGARWMVAARIDGYSGAGLVMATDIEPVIWWAK